MTINEIKVAMVGLDTSHATEFAKRMNGVDCPENQRVSGLRVVNCLSFYTQFMKDETRKKKQENALAELGVNITEDFDKAVADCDAVMIEINDPSLHLEYFRKCADLGKPIFLDKPMADTVANGQAIYDLAKQTGLRVISSSSLRFVPELERACTQIPEPRFVNTYGPLGQAPAGSGIIWYGVHTFEMLQRAMGRGAQTVTTHKDDSGIVAIVQYPDHRRGIVELSEDAWVYGGCLRMNEEAQSFSVDFTFCYTSMLKIVAEFFSGEKAPLEFEDTLEVMALLEATQRSNDSGQTEPVEFSA